MTTWWQRGAIYQIYPRSFADADGDGVGDLRGHRRAARPPGGARRRGGLAVADLPLADGRLRLRRRRLLRRRPAVRHARGLRRAGRDVPRARHPRASSTGCPNHTSDQHPWFEASRSSRDDPKRDWYVWRDGAPDGGPPNDWTSAFARRRARRGRSTSATGQWYLHSFLPEQPDLNWDNPEVEAAMHDVLRFWLDRGVDGFRLDAIAQDRQGPAAARPRRRAAPPRRGLGHDPRAAARHPPRGRRVRRPHDRRRGRAAGPAPRRQLPAVTATSCTSRTTSSSSSCRGTPRRSARSIDDFEALADRRARGRRGSSPTTTSSRVASRFDDDGHGPRARARSLLMLYALRGTPFLYQGEELGLPDAEIPPERVVDVDGRDPERAPIPWQPPSEAGPGAGFTHRRAVAAARRRGGGAERRRARPPTRARRSRSYRRLAALRAGSAALQTGSQRTLDVGAGAARLDPRGGRRAHPRDRQLPRHRVGAGGRPRGR